MNSSTKKLPVWRKLIYGIGKGGGDIFSQVSSAFLLSYYTDTALIGAAAIGTMFVVCRVFDGISDFVMGALIDKTNTKLGKARPWLIAAGPLMLLGFILVLNVPASAPSGFKLLYAYATYIFMTVVVYTMFGVAHTALLPLMTRNAKDSTVIATYSAVINSSVALVASSAITPLVTYLGWTVTSVILGLVSCVLLLICGIGSRELTPEELAEGNDAEKPGKEKAGSPLLKKQLPAVLKNRYFWMLILINVFTLIQTANSIAAQVYYCNYVLGNALFMSTLVVFGQFPSIIMMFTMPIISNKWSKKVYMVLGACMLILGFVICGIAGTNTTLLIIGTVVRALGAGPLTGGVMAIVPEVVEYGNWKYGVRTAGLISSSQSIGSKIGIGFGSAICAWTLAAAGYDALAETQTAAVLSVIKFNYTWCGAILSAVILVLVLLLNVERYASQYRPQT